MSQSDDSFECMVYDAHLPSMTVRFRIPEGFPLAGGVYRIERIRNVTTDDMMRFMHLPEPPEYDYGQ